MIERFQSCCLCSTLLVASVAILVGCGGKAASDSSVAIHEDLKGAPEWVLRGHDDDVATVSGVGSVSGTRNASLARSTAVARGRTEIGRQLDVEIQAMLEDYQATTTGGGAFGEAAADEQHIRDVTRQITRVNLTGTRVVDTWISESGTYYALVSLDVAVFEDAISRMDSLSEDVREAVSARAADAFADLDAFTDGR